MRKTAEVRINGAVRSGVMGHLVASSIFGCAERDASACHERCVHTDSTYPWPMHSHLGCGELDTVIECDPGFDADLIFERR